MSPKKPPAGISSSQTRASGPGKSGGTDGDTRADCTFNQVVDLAGVRMDVASAVSEGDVLAVRLEGAIPNRSVVCVTRPGGAIVGAVVGIPGLARLLACIEAGQTYDAHVLVRQRSHCEVRIVNATL